MFMGRVRTWLRPELAIGAAGIVILGLVVVQLVLIQVHSSLPFLWILQTRRFGSSWCNTATF